jgi:hypothetical protein
MGLVLSRMGPVDQLQLAYEQKCVVPHRIEDSTFEKYNKSNPTVLYLFCVELDSISVFSQFLEKQNQTLDVENKRLKDKCTHTTSSVFWNKFDETNHSTPKYTI